MTQKFIVRADRAGVFYGEIKERKGSEVTMTNVRRVWYWEGANTLSQLAMEGVKAKKISKITMAVSEMTILGVIEVIPCSEEAVNNLDSVAEWKL